MEANFRGLRNVFLGVYIACFLFFVFSSQLPKLYAQEGKDCCSQSQCSFGYTCVGIPSPCPDKEKYGSCTKSITQCSPGKLNCPPGQYCVDYICITLGPGTPTPGGGQTRPRMRHEFANSWTLAARNCAIIFATARS